MSNQIVTYLHQGETLPPEEETINKFHSMWNAAAQIDDDAQSINEMDLEVLRRVRVVSNDNSEKPALINLRELGEGLVKMGMALITMADNKRFLCVLMDRRRA